MKKKNLLIIAALVALAVPAHAQLFEAVSNPLVVAGGTYQLEQPTTGHRAAPFLSANIAGVKLGALPLYIGGVGVALPATVAEVASQFGNFAQLTIPAVTYFPAGDKFLVQAGYSYVLNGDAQSKNGVYAAVGFAWNSPKQIQYNRAKKLAKKLGKAAPAPCESYPCPY